MYLNILTTSEVDIDDFYITEDDPRIEDWELDEFDIGSYLIAGINFTSYEEVTTYWEPEMIQVIIDDYDDFGKAWRDYPEEEWIKMVEEFCDKHQDATVYSGHCDACVF